MKKVLSLILALSMLLSLTSFAAITQTQVYKDNTTGYTYIFGKFEDGDTKVGFEINGKEYDLDKADVNDPSKTAFEVAKEKGNIFGIGFLDKTSSSETLSAVPYTYDTDGNKKLQEDVVNLSMPECNNLYLEDLKIKGETVASFSPYKSYYYYETDDVSSITADDITAEVQAEYANAEVTKAGNNINVIITAPDCEPRTVEVRVREKGELQNADEQVAPLKGLKNVKFDEEYNKTFLFSDIATSSKRSFYDADNLRLKSSAARGIIHPTDTNFSLGLVQFDISNITNVNDRVLLKLPVKNESSSGRVAQIGFMAVNNELSINYHTSSNPYFTGLIADEVDNEYSAKAESLKAANFDNETINQEIKNAFNMTDYSNIENDIAERMIITSASVEPREVDVTDYVKAKLENGDDTVTFMIRAINDIDVTSDAQIIVRAYVGQAELYFEKFEGEIAPSDIKVNGTTIEGFNKNTFNYDVEVSAGETVPEVTATITDTENLTLEVAQATEIPGSATVTVTSYDGQTRIYTINFSNPFEKAEFTLNAVYRIQRNTAGIKLNTWLSDIGTAQEVKTTVYKTTGTTRDGAIIQFKTDADGINDGDKIILTVYASAHEEEGKTGRVLINGLVDEKYVYTASAKTGVPVLDTTIPITALTLNKPLEVSEYQAYEFDVTAYVKARLEKGEKQISFAVELTDDNWSTEKGEVLVYVGVAGDNAPDLSCK